MKGLFIAFSLFAAVAANAQERLLIPEKNNAATPVKNQGATGSCWSFSTTSLIESESIRKGVTNVDLSEMFTVRNIYLEKAKNYVRRQGDTRFDEGGLAHDVIHSVDLYGIVPESVYSGLKGNAKTHDHSQMVPLMKKYLDSIIKSPAPIPDNWIDHITAILDEHMGKPPASFEYNGKTYTPQTFAKEVLKFNANDYVGLTSFTHHPFYQSFIVEVPDNFSNGAYYNIPLNDLISATESAVRKGCTVAWDADVSNRGFAFGKGYALYPPANTSISEGSINPDMQEGAYTQESRQKLYEELVTQDDHLMHITGIEKSKQGKTFFVVKNSWGLKVGPFEGYVNVSEAYFAINTITLMLPKSALDKELLKKINAQTK
ncbi:MAG TPA: C1 family peptidase [Chitinophaga sp.]|uniref:C1 family peptidase n=1 Tax=Chitinophaga sp. TaxID=1869181 RepID=UPI002BDC5433|nr:C1 family peptidase [Chitinophaga sp.]HVI47349.1 C1 family peptidase [Chitinophaga sp.]